MLHYGRDPSSSGSFNDSCSSESSKTSPMNSPYVSPGSSPRESLTHHFAHSMSLQPPLNKPNTNTFVHKLYNMVMDDQYQHLIAWSYTGQSFIVCNIMDFSRDVLPKHFKHNNFSSFVRQLNMYGFHKVNKSPRGHRTSTENQIWEFSHLKFIKDRQDLLDDIKRKTVEPERKDQQMNNIQHSHSEMIQRIMSLQNNLNQVIQELAETKSRQSMQHALLTNMIDFITQRHMNSNDGFLNTPSIYVTSHDLSHKTRNPPLTVQTDNLVYSPSLSVYHTAQNTPISPRFLEDDLYHTPTAPSFDPLQPQYFK